jgi:phosphatidylserine decarboxylase
MFEFGGSTIVAAVQKGRVTIDGDILANTKNGFETVVKFGEKIGEREARQ